MDKIEKTKTTYNDAFILNDEKAYMIMKAAVCESPARFSLCSVPVRKPLEREILVKIEGCGVCGSNIPVWEGRSWFNYPLTPGAPGHEGWGMVEKTGEGVTEFTVGDRVAILSQNAFAQYDVVNVNSAVKLPEKMNNVAFPGEPFGCAMNIIERSNIKKGNTVAVVGCGFLGSLIVALACKAGANVIALSRRKTSLDMAKKYGAEGIELKGYNETLKYLRKKVNDEGFDRVIEAAGHQWTLDFASEIVKVRGKLIIAGYHQDGLRTVNMQQWNWRGIDVVNAHERDVKQYVKGIKMAVNVIQNGTINTSDFITHQFSLENITDAFNIMRARPEGFLKAVVTL